ncbi:MAG: cytochrome c [Chloroflexi bacterium]|nr:cytochrome c [Chloroflexota bacterium]
MRMAARRRWWCDQLLRHPLAGAAGLLILIWAGLPLVPEASGLHFSVRYRLFLSAFAVAGGLFFALLRLERVPAPRSGWGVLGSVAAVYLAAVGLLVVVGSVYPQYGLPRAGSAVETDSPAGRGKALFWDPSVGCFQCHTFGGAGGQRGPDLSRVAAVAGTRQPGVSAQEYILGHIGGGSSYFTVPGYPPIMPPFGQRLSPEQQEALLAFLLAGP